MGDKNIRKIRFTDRSQRPNIVDTKDLKKILMLRSQTSATVKSRFRLIVVCLHSFCYGLNILRALFFITINILFFNEFVRARAIKPQNKHFEIKGLV